MTDKIPFSDFKKIDLRIARVESVERIEGSDKLLKLAINAGGEARTLVAGIGASYEPESLIGRGIAVVMNLEPRVIFGVESNGMLLAADDGRPVLLGTDRSVPPGTIIR